MSFKKPHPCWLIGIVFVLLLASLACNVPIMASQSNQEQEPGFVETSVAETMIAIVENSNQNQDVSNEDSNEDQANDTEEDADPTLTFTPEVTDTPTLTPTVTNTPTPQVAMIYASANTNCREGQGTGFAWLTSLAAGQTAEAVGVENSGEFPYWYVRRPDQPESFCWLWGKYATPSGPFEELPVYTPMPTPTPGFDFQIEYVGLAGPCSGGSYWTQYRITNNGAFTLESYRTKATDNTGGTNPQEWKLDQFTDMSGCVLTNQQNDLAPGESSLVIAKFDSDPSGHDITTRIKICQEDGLNEPCLVKTYNHTP
jgi:hypothetical protein